MKDSTLIRVNLMWIVWFTAQFCICFLRLLFSPTELSLFVPTDTCTSDHSSGLANRTDSDSYSFPPWGAALTTLPGQRLLSQRADGGRLRAVLPSHHPLSRATVITPWNDWLGERAFIPPSLETMTGALKPVWNLNIAAWFFLNWYLWVG